MKQSKKKLATKFQVDFNFNEVLKSENNVTQSIDYEKFSKVLLQNEDKEVTQGFVFDFQGKPIIIPEPDPCLIYFTTAESYLETIIKLKLDLKRQVGTENITTAGEIFFSLYPLVATFIITLFASIEAFQNGEIPIDFTYIHRRKSYDRIGIQRFVDFTTKMSLILPKIHNKSFQNENHVQFELLQNLKSLRDNIVHTKNMSKGYPACYGEIYGQSLKLDYQNTYEATKNYINFYKPGWIEEMT